MAAGEEDSGRPAKRGKTVCAVEFRWFVEAEQEPWVARVFCKMTKCLELVVVGLSVSPASR